MDDEHPHNLTEEHPHNPTEEHPHNPPIDEKHPSTQPSHGWKASTQVPIEMRSIHTIPPWTKRMCTYDKSTCHSLHDKIGTD